MALKLKWKNRNVVATTVSIYRGDAPLDNTALPAPLVVLTNGEQEWVDQTAEFGKTYYYILGAVTEHDTVLTANQKILVADNRGAGPGTLLYGDDNLGYYGTLLSSDFFNSSHVLAVAKQLTGIPSALVQPIWHKFVRKGKIIYVPDRPFGSAAWTYLYAAGLVYGVDATVPETGILTGLTPVNQLCKMELNGEYYKPRLMRGWSDGPFNDQRIPNSVADHDTMIGEDNEWNDLMYPLFWPVPFKQRSENFANASWDSIVGAPTANWSSGTQVTALQNGGCVVCQERIPSSVNQIVVRGLRNVVYGPNNNSGVHSRDYISRYGTLSISGAYNWVPVIELIDETTATLKV